MIAVKLCLDFKRITHLSDLVCFCLQKGLFITASYIIGSTLEYGCPFQGGSNTGGSIYQIDSLRFLKSLDPLKFLTKKIW